MQKFSSFKDLNQRSEIRFIRTVGAPKFKHPNQIKTYHELPPTSNSKHHILLIELNYQNNPTQNYRFPYNQSTTVLMLITFLKYKLKRENIFFKSNAFHLDYFLTLENHLLSELTITLLKLTAQNITLRSSLAAQSIENMHYFSNSMTSLASIQIIKCIGCGGFSKVFLGRMYGKMLAVKAVDKNFIISTNKQTIIENQRLILGICQGHPFITKLYAAFQTNNFVVFVMEYCNGGELFNLLRKVKKMKEKDAKFYFLETLTAIEFLHSKGILYRDLKPQNIMLDADGHVRLADFGLSKIINDDLTYSFCGSAQYMSPEMLLKKGHGYEVDYYCIGALLYQLVTGLPPYYTTDQAELFNNILNSELAFPSHTNLSDEIKDFLLKILEKDISKRFRSIKEIMSHPWVANDLNKQDLAKRRLKPPYPTDIFMYNFDDGEFVHEEKKIMQSIKEEALETLKNTKFPQIYYQSKQIVEIKRKLEHEESRSKFLKNKEIARASSIVPSKNPLTRSRQESVNSAKSKNSNTNLYYFPSRRQSTDNILFNPTLPNAKSTPSLNRYFIKNDRDLQNLRKQSLNTSLSQKNSIDINNSYNSNYSRNIYTSKAGYYQNRNPNKINNHYYFNRFLNNQIYQRNSVSNKSGNIRQQLSAALLDSRLQSSINSNNYRSLQKSKKKLSVSLSKSLNKNTLLHQKLQMQNTNYSKKVKGSQQQNLSKKYLQNFKGKLNISRIKKSGISVSEKSNFYNGYRQPKR